MREAARDLAVDAAVLAAYAAAANPALTGVGVHEWLGLGRSCSWSCTPPSMAGGWRRPCAPSARAPLPPASGNLAVDALAFVALAACAVSGLLVSGDVLRAFGWYAEGYYFWDPLHAVSAKVLLALVVVHVALHAKWIAAWFRKGKAGRPGGREEA